MDRPQFWAMMQTAKATSGRDIQRQTTLLEQKLRGLPLTQIVGFQRILEELHAESRRVALWGAALTIDPDIWTEDRFFAFRGWLIAQGQHVYEAAVADPDSLADYADLRTDWPPGSPFPWYWGEGLWSVALNAYGDRTGEEIPELAGWPGELIGNWWAVEEDRADLQRRYPRLWARFRQC
jgi:Protein of unknown function (DUF4240)